jgi:hypothetical protein
MIRLRILFLSMLTALPGWAQNAGENGAEKQSSGIQIHGTVTEIGLGGLAAAQVTVYEFAGPEREKRVLTTTVTGGDGRFQIDLARFGDYWVEVKKEAYFASIPIEGPGSQVSLASQKPPAAETGTLVTVSAAHPTAQVRFSLMRPGGLTGTVLDEADKPLAHMLVELWMAGAPALSHSTAQTDNNGVFHTRTLMPGAYIVQISPRADIFLTPFKKFSDDEMAVIDEGLEGVYWPNARDEASATPARISPGSEASLGVVRLRKTPSYRAHVSMGGCRAENLPVLSVIDRANPTSPLDFTRFLLPLARKLDSCEDVIVLALKPGSYTFVLTAKGEFAAAPVEIGNKNREVKLTLTPTADISGGFTASDDVKIPDLSNVRVDLKPAESGAANISVSRPDVHGIFGAKGLSNLAYRVVCYGLSDRFYVKEIRVDGQPAPDGIVHFYSGSKLELVLDNHPATLTGSVTDRGEAFSQPLIYLVKWPSQVEVKAHPVTGDNSGQFQIGGLEPGEYRILAVSSTPLPDGEQIGLPMLNRLWSAAESLVLDRGETKTSNLTLSDPLN